MSEVVEEKLPPCWDSLPMEPSQVCNERCGWYTYSEQHQRWQDLNGQPVLSQNEQYVPPGIFCPCCGAPVSYREGEPVSGPTYQPSGCPCPLVEESQKLNQHSAWLRRWGVVMTVACVMLWTNGFVGLWGRYGEWANHRFMAGVGLGVCLTILFAYGIEYIFFRPRRAQALVRFFSSEQPDEQHLIEEYVIKGYKFPVPKPRQRKGPGEFERNPDFPLTQQTAVEGA